MARRANPLNDLTNREWLKETKSFWLSQGPRGTWTEEDLAALTQWLCERHGEERAGQMLSQIFPSTMYSQAPPRDSRKLLHPATFSEKDVERLIRFFTKKGEKVLDPFVGTGSTLVACQQCGRSGVGIELVEQWAQIACERLARAKPFHTSSFAPCASQEMNGQIVIRGDAQTELSHFPDNMFDFIVTSPPYWRILDKKGLKIKTERESRHLPTKYSESALDLGNIPSYEDFLAKLAEIFAECRRVLKPKRYLAVIVSDFRDGPRFVLYHADLARRIEQIGLPLKGITILLQDNKNLYPFGVPFAFVSNIHHQYILIHQKIEA